MTETSPHLILASRSAARRAILDQAGLRFDVIDAGVEEGAVKTRMLAKGASPAEVAAALAREKALAASRSAPAGSLVIGSDQVLDLDGALIDKAVSLDEARVRLLSLRGRAHWLRSAVAVARDGVIVWEATDSARLTLRSFSETFLDAYLAREGEALLSSVGCYRLEGLGAQLFDQVEGDYFTVLGLPLWPLLAALRDLGALES